MYIREIKQIYTLGQIEPKEPVYSPQSRDYGAFLKKRVQAFALKLLERYNNRINFNELRTFFTIFNDQILKKTLKEIDVEVDRNQDAFLMEGESIEDKTKNLITPENVGRIRSFLDLSVRICRVRNKTPPKIRNLEVDQPYEDHLCSEQILLGSAEPEVQEVR